MMAHSGRRLREHQLIYLYSNKRLHGITPKNLYVRNSIMPHDHVRYFSMLLDFRNLITNDNKTIVIS